MHLRCEAANQGKHHWRVVLFLTRTHNAPIAPLARETAALKVSETWQKGKCHFLMEEGFVKTCEPHRTYRCLCVSFVAVMLLVANPTHAQVKVTTIAGGFINDGQPATSSALQSPEGGRMDKAGSLYIADQLDHRLRKVSTTGVITTIAGTGIAGYSGDGGPAASAQIRFPVDVVIDFEGSIIFSDSGNNRIRKINSSGIITTIAGTGVAGFSGDGGPATSAKLNHPNGLNLDSGGDLYFADNLNQRIRKIDTGGGNSHRGRKWHGRVRR